jgi:signal transduction histidine kinase
VSDGISSARLTQALAQAALALGRTRDAEEVVRVAVAETQRAAGFETVSLYLIDREHGMLNLREFAGVSPALRKHPLPEGAPHPTATFQDLYAAQGFRHALAVTVAGQEQTLGVLVVAARSAAQFASEDASLLQALAGLIGVALENAALRETLTLQRDRLRALSAGAEATREAESRRIAHELHDEAGQLLASVHIALDSLAPQVPEAKAPLQHVHELLDRVEAQLRRLSRELRPTILDDLGLGPAVEWLAKGMGERSGIPIQVDVSLRRLPGQLETAAYRIAQEAITNAVRHGGATQIAVRMRESTGWVELDIQDNGRGFDAAATLERRGDRGLGLLGIRERADSLGGTLRIISRPGAGACVSVRLPVEAET